MRRRLWLSLAVTVWLWSGLGLALVRAQPQRVQWETMSRVTFYTDAGWMASGYWTFGGAAACGSAIPMYSTVTILEAGVTVQCLDRGWLAPMQVDVSSPSGRPAWLTQDFYLVEVQ